MPSASRSASRRSSGRSPYDRLKKFYTDWYRPDLMAVVAVGDFDPAAIEALIRSHFGAIPAAASPAAAAVYDVPDQPGTRYTVATDPEATATTVGVSSMMAARDQTTVGAYRQQTIERVFSGLLSARFAEMAQKPDAPFLDAETSRGLFVRSTEATTLSALVAEGGVETRAGGALHRSRSRRPLRLHADRAGSLSARLPAGLRAARRLERRAHLAVAGRRVHPQLHAAGADSRHRVRERSGPALPAGDHARRHQQPGPRLGAGSQPRRRRQRAEEGRA